tara:strand:+ start:19148 stop:19717 length:570 start_codon:yes stop_codon:yes gene_type:complete
MSYYRDQLEAYLKTLDVKTPNCLDIGGSQLPIKKRVRSWDVKEYKILDLQIPHKGEKPDIIYDLNSMSVSSEKPNQWHTVFCLEVMEYIYNSLRAIQNIRYFTKMDGILYITFPFVYPHHNPRKEDYLRYTEWGVIKLMRMSSFKIEDIIYRYGRGNNLVNFYTSEGMRASKDYAKHNAIGFIIKAKAI